MSDVLTPEQRHYNMSQIKGKNTKPEIRLRKLIFSLGYRYRLHVSDLPGKPDLVFPSKKKVIFLNGCFWHMHDCKYGAVVPKTNSEFWINKRLGTVSRDKKNFETLISLGWQVLVIWECELRDEVKVIKLVTKYLSS